MTNKEWTELRDVNEKTRTYEDGPNFRDLKKFRNARRFLSGKRNPIESGTTKNFLNNYG